jgi:GLPGLI family protein
MRYRINIFLALVIFANFTKAQTHRFIYDVIYKKDSTSEITTKENYILGINRSGTLFYTLDFYLADSLINNNIPFPKDMKLNTSNIIGHKTGNDNFEEYDLMENTVLNLKTVNHQNWKLTSEKKHIKNLILQKAITNCGGRNWNAWFSPNLPFQEGPHEFHGLPGLIIELSDDKNNYRFELAKSEKITNADENQFIEMAKQMSIPVD